MDWKRAKARIDMSYWPIPAGMLAGALLLLAVALFDDGGAPRPAAPGPSAAPGRSGAVSAVSPGSAVPLPGFRTAAAAPGPVQAPAPGSVGILLPPRSAASELTRRIEGGIPSAAPETPRIRLPAPAARPRIAVVIDDMGFDRVQSARAVRLPPEVTLAYLPYAPEVARQVRRARLVGHDIILHLPMEATDAGSRSEPDVLTLADSLPVLRENLDKMLGRFGGYIGVNNHMGSRFTSDRGRMDIVLGELKRRGLFFLDSRTSGRSVGVAAAADIGIPYAARDVFLDHEPEVAKIRARMAEAEDIARASGQAVVIGHPRRMTMDEIAPWLDGLRGRGIDLVPVARLLVRPEGKRLARYQAAE